MDITFRSFHYMNVHLDLSYSFLVIVYWRHLLWGCRFHFSHVRASSPATLRRDILMLSAFQSFLIFITLCVEVLRSILPAMTTTGSAQCLLNLSLRNIVSDNLAGYFNTIRVYSTKVDHLRGTIGGKMQKPLLVCPFCVEYTQVTWCLTWIQAVWH